MIPEDGFTLVELMITMVVFVLAMVAASNIFTGLLSQFKQQSRIAESNIEGISGLELLRHDMEQAGFGLPWNLNGVNYNEAAVDTAANDDNGGTNSNPPRPVVVLNNTGLNGSDVLAIKATNIATSAASQKWEYIVNNGALPNLLRDWGGALNPAEKISGSDHVIIINPSAGSNVGNQKVLVNSDVRLDNGSFSFVSGSTTDIYSPFEPTMNSYTAYVVYGVSPGPLRMPFNRADFYVKQPPDTDGDGWPDGLPRRCQPNTGILYKATINHADGKLTELPLVDCVLDMQVVVALDTNGSGSANAWVDNLNDAVNYPARVIRDQLKEIRVYLIVQEGQMDTSYTYANPDPSAPVSDRNMVYVRDPNYGNVYGTTKNGYTVPDLNYRWKLHTIVITPYNLQ